MQVVRKATSLTIAVGDESETDRVGRALAGIAGPGTVIGLVGPLGAGKTRLVRALAEALGAEPAAIASPTFVLIHEYDARLPIYHFDAYRLAGPDEFEALGAAEYFDGEGVSLVEWADLVSGLLPARAWWVRIEPTSPDGRQFHVEIPDATALDAVWSAV